MAEPEIGGPAPDAAAPRPSFLLAGDCLDLHARLERCHGWDGKLADVAYLDPPFNTGGYFGARIGEGKRRTYVARNDESVAYEDTWGGVDGFLAMLGPRLAAVRDLLVPHGTLLLHLPPEVAHDAKVLADGIFCRRSYLGEIIWVPGNGARGRRMPVTHHLILAYIARVSHLSEAVWNAHDPALREPYAETSRSMHFRNVDASGRHFRERVINGKAYRYFADEGRLRGSVWTDLPAMSANTPIGKEGTGYPTQKPLALLDRLLRATSRPGDRVLDPMCGSGTTLVAAHALGRSFIGNDRGKLAVETSRKRLEASGVPFTTSNLDVG